MKKRKSKNFPVILFVAGGLLLIFTAVLLVSQNNSQPIAQSSPVASGHDEETYPEIKRVSLDDAKAALDAKTAVFVDVRGVDAYAMSHVAGSLSIPLADLETRLGELDPNQWIITYCTWPSEESSARAASILLDNGFQNVTPLLGGFNVWTSAGYPVQP